LLQDFILYGRKIHRDVSPVSDRQWLNDMKNMELCVILAGEGRGATDNRFGRGPEIDCHENILVGHTSPATWMPHL